MGTGLRGLWRAAATTATVVAIAGGVTVAASDAGAKAAQAPVVVTGVTPTSGRLTAGTPVTVRGSGFGRGAIVYFGTARATSVVATSSTTITARTPAHAAGIVFVRVRFLARLSPVTDRARFSYVAPPAITALSRHSAPTYGGADVTVSGRGFTSDSTVVFGTTPARQVVVNSSGSIDAITPSHAAGSAPVRVSTRYGSSGTSAFTFDARPVITYVTTVYAGQQASITGESLAGATAVRFGGRPAQSFRVLDAGSVVAVAPTHFSSASTDVTVTTGVGTSAPFRTDVHYASPPPVDRARALPHGTDAVALDWHTSGPDPVIIRRAAGTTAPATSADGDAVADVGARTTEYLDRGLAPGTTYTYSLFSYGDGDAAARTITVTTADSSHGFTSPTISDLPHAPAGTISCPTTTFCLAADGLGNVYTYDGSAWSGPQAIDRRHPILSVSCTSKDFCVTVDDVGYAVTLDAGTWSAPVLLAEDDGPYLRSDERVSCSSASFCLATSDARAFVLGRDPHGAVTWSATATPTSASSSAYPISGVSCPADNSCAAVSTGGQALLYRDGTWTVGYTGTSSGYGSEIRLLSVTCASTTACFAVDADGRVVRYDGSTWTRTTDPVVARDHTSADYRGGVACSAPTSCVLVIQGRAAHFDGTSWSAPRTIDARTTADRELAGIACAPGGDCRAVDGAGLTYVYSAGVWSPAGAIGVFGGGPSSISCVDTSWCLSVAGSGEYYVTDGATWPRPTQGPTGLGPVSCVTRTYCVAGRTTGSQFPGFVGSVVTFDGTSWSAPVALQDATAIVGVSCPSQGSCTAQDAAGHAYAYDGVSWSAPVQLPHSLSVGRGGVSCATGGFCAAVSGDGLAVVQRVGGTWTTALETASGDSTSAGTFVSVSCSSSSFCAAVTSLGGYAFWDGTAWSRGALAQDLPRSLAGSVSCRSAESCVAVVGQYALLWDGTTWSTYRPRFETDVNTSYIPVVGASVVPGTGRAVVVYSDGFAVTANGV